MCSCGENYIHETILNVEEFWSEHNSVGNKPKQVKHLVYNEKHSLLWSILFATPEDGRTRKNLESFFITKLNASLSRQEDLNTLCQSFFIMPLLFHLTEAYSK